MKSGDIQICFWASDGTTTYVHDSRLSKFSRGKPPDSRNPVHKYFGPPHCFDAGDSADEDNYDSATGSFDSFDKFFW